MSLVNPRSPMVRLSTKGTPNLVLTNLFVGYVQVYLSE
jgi:hypothetical protein